MRCYHRTPFPEKIIREGFRDATGTYLTGEFHTGVWLADRPVDANEGAKGEYLLAIDVPDDVFRQYEWEKEDDPAHECYRESLLAAAVVNGFGPPVLVEGPGVGWTRGQVAQFFEAWQSHNHSRIRQRLARLRELLPFLEQQGLILE